jgi:Rrf2 family protein
MEDTRFSVSIQIMLTLAVHENLEKSESSAKVISDGVNDRCSGLTNSEDLAKLLKTNPTFIRKLVSSLVEQGLVQSIRGQSGGFRLKKEPNKITLSEIYKAATNKKQLISVHNKPTTKHCAVSCAIQRIVCEIAQGIEESTEKYLGKKKLSDLMKTI